jgi:hypothetical protein
MWCKHTTEDCCTKKRAPDGTTTTSTKGKGDKSKDDGQTKSPATLSIAKALVAISEGEEYASDDESNSSS